MVNKVTIGNEVKIRQAEIKDAARITILAEQLGYSVTNQQVEERLTKITHNSSHTIYVATLENDYVIGWAHAYIRDSIVIQTPAILLGLVVDRDYRYQGVGRFLMEKIENWATLAGSEGVLLRSNIKRKEAICFTKKLAIPISNSH